MYSLRKYQEEAVNATFDYLINKDGNPLVEMCGATGKSVVIAATCRRAIEMAPRDNILVVTHNRDLVKQNCQKLHAIAPELSIGVYSAGLSKKQTNKQITFCSIQSIWRHAFKFPSISLLLVDEAHTIPLKDMGTWRKFIADLKTANPFLRVIGYTATAYRLGQGVLTEGDNKLFDETCYEYGILRAIEEGYICPPKNVRTELHYDTSNLKKRGGEFVEKELQAAVNIDHLNRKCIDEVMKWGAERKTWLGFCSGKDHTIAVRDILREKGKICEAILGDTPKDQRDAFIEGARNGEIDCLVNNNCLTTGTDIPNIGLIFCMRPTGSAGLWSQILMRGFRLHESKKDFIVCDFTQNTPTHGLLDKIRPKGRVSDGTGEAPHKLCGSCMSVVAASARECPDCGYIFEIDSSPKITGKAVGGALLSTDLDIRTLSVKSVHYARHKKLGKPDSLKITYLVNEEIKTFPEWIFPESQNRSRFESWWRKRSKQLPPIDVAGCLELQKTLMPPATITVRFQGKYPEILAHTFA